MGVRSDGHCIAKDEENRSCGCAYVVRDAKSRWSRGSAQLSPIRLG